MHKVAQTWSDAGFVVVATNPKSKRPIGRWRDIKHTPKALLEEWPTDAGIGFLTGPSNLVVVDLDVKSRDTNGNLIDGISSWAALLQRLGLPDFPAQETTPSGGRHVYFFADDAYPISNSASAKQGIDVRGVGGFIVAAPTPGYTHTAGVTPSDFETKIHVMPEILKQYFANGNAAQKGTVTAASAARAALANEDPQGAARRAVDRFRAGDIPSGELGQGNRNVALHYVACRLWELDAISPGIADEFYDEVVDTLNDVPGPAMDADEISKTWQSARRNAEDSPIATDLPVRDRPATDLGNAKRLHDYLARKGTPAHFTPEAGYLLWDGKRWHRDLLGAVRTAAQHVAEEVRDKAALDWERAQAEGDTNKLGMAKAAKQWGKYTQSSNGLSAMLTIFQHLPGVSVSLADFDTSPELLNVNNGTLNLRTGELSPHNPDNRLTKVVHYDYRPDAPAERWEQFLTEVFPDDPEMTAYYKRLIGYGITGEVSEQCLAICHSTGSSGKSVAVDTLAHVFDEYTHITDYTTFESSRTGGASPEIVALRGARLVFASEGTAGAPLAEATVKKLTGSERITARDLYKSPVTFMPTALIVLSTNHVPVIKGQDDGIWRRCRSIHWPVQFTKETRDPNLAVRLKNFEAEGILRWAVEGAQEWYRDGLNDPESIMRAVEEYRVSQDILADFLPGVLVLDTEARVELKEGYALYLSWAAEVGLQPRDIVNRKMFQRLMDERKVPTVIGHARKRYLRGVRKVSKDDVVRLEVAG